MGYQYVLGQVEVTSYITPLNPYSVLYQVPEPAITEVGPVSGEVEVSPKVQSQLVQTLVTGITVCNHDDNQQYVYMRLTAGGGSDPDDSFYLHLATALPVGTTKILNHGLVLSSGDFVSVTAWGGFGGSVNTDYTLFGVETTSLTGPS